MAIFFQAVAVTELLYSCTTLTLVKHLNKRFDVNCTRMLYAVLNKFWKQHPTKQWLYGHLLPTSRNIDEQAMRDTAREIRIMVGWVLWHIISCRLFNAKS